MEEMRKIGKEVTDREIIGFIPINRFYSLAQQYFETAVIDRKVISLDQLIQ